MRTIVERIEDLRARPHQVRKQVALTSAGGIAVVIGLIWFGVSLGSGAYAIHGSNFAEATGAEASPNAAPSAPQTSQIAGAAAALDTADAGPAHIVIVDASSSSAAPSTSAEQTTIPF